MFDKKAYRQGAFKDLAKDKARLDAVKTAIRDLNSGGDPMPALSMVDLPSVFVVHAEWGADELRAHFKEFGPAVNALAGNDVGKTLKQLFDGLKDKVEDPGFWTRLRAGGEEARKQRLAAFVAAVRADYPLGVITVDQAMDVARSMGLAAVTEGEVVASLKEGGVVSVAPFEPPAITVPVAVSKVLSLPEFRTLAHLLCAGQKNAALAGVRVIDDFAKPDGTRFSTADIDGAVLACNQGSSNAMLAGQKALTVIKSDFGRPELLHGLALAAAVSRASELLMSGQPRLVVREQLVADGWHSLDASRIVIALGQPTSAGAASEPTLELAASRLSDGQLAEATRVLGAVPVTDENRSAHAALSRTIDEAEAKKAARVAESRRAAESGDFVAAAQALRAAMVIDAGDESLAAQLETLPPPRPFELTVSPRGRAAVLSWTGPADSGSTFVVVRSTVGRPAHHQDGELIATGISGSSATDDSPPIARNVHYAVFATRDGQRFSAPTHAEHMVLPPVLSLDASADQQEIRLSWSSPSEALGVLLTVKGPDGRPRTSEESASGSKSIPGLTLGARYDVSAVARYRIAGELRSAPPVDASVVPRGAIRAVTDLQLDHATDLSDDRVRLSWSPVIGYEVEVWAFPITVQVGAGIRVALDKLAASGGTRLAVRDAGTVQGRQRGEVAADERVQRLVAVTVADREGLVGNSVVAGRATPPPEVTVLPLGEDARLSWVWGDPEHDYVLEWSEVGSPRRELVTRARYEGGGGYLLRSQRTVEDLRISRVVRSGLDEWVSRPRQVALSSTSVVHVSYDLSLKKSRFAGGASAVLTARADGFSGVVEVTGVVKSGGLMPTNARDGTLLGPLTLTFDRGSAEPHTVSLGKPGSPYWVRFFAHSPDVVLYDPPTTRLKG